MVKYHGDRMSTAEVQLHGRQTFLASYEEVFEASVVALKGLGYEVVGAKAERGLITTAPKHIKSLAHTSGSHSELSLGISSSSASSERVDFYRRYRLEVRQVDSSVRVVAQPSIHRGASDSSHEPMWDLDSPLGERSLWDQLFLEIKSQL